ncbi:MAG: hypothetical protein PHR39_03890 [Actinomycetota bacterium]|nr:hypothetical protein [Actinomycetota bacterium]
MKKILIILLLITSILFIGCSKEIIVDTTAKTVTETSIVKIEDNTKINELEKQLKHNKDELEKCQELISNLNELLGNTYFVYQKKSDGSWIIGTGFSLKYKDKYYLITAGHIVENEYGVFKNLGFKANFSNDWIYPKLLTYGNNFQFGRDFAVFYSAKVKEGLILGDYILPAFILGNGKINLIKGSTDKTFDGESGSPIININGEVIGIMTGGSTNMNYVTEAIDNLK